ncbi:MAG: nucleoside hydrolase [Cyanophyceae cyanobacterium]
MDHDGAIDDFLAMMLLLTMECQTAGIVVTPADCYVEAAVSVTRKILALMQREEVPVAKSTVRGLNPFPASFRRDSIVIDHFPILNERQTRPTLVEESGPVFMAQTLQQAAERVTLLVTGPLTTVAAALERMPAIAHRIARIVWMGGALTVPGNVAKAFAPEHDGSAEWNVFWDPIAAGKVWQTDIPLVLCPLDITNTVPVTAEFAVQFAERRRFPLCDLAGLCYALAMPQDYYCWDVLATAYLARPELYQVQERETSIVTTGTSQGRVKLESGGRKVLVMESVEKEQFCSYLLEQFTSARL